MKLILSIALTFIMTASATAQAQTSKASSHLKKHTQPLLEAQATKSDLKDFLQKFTDYNAKFHQLDREPMPIFYSEESSLNMPNPVPPDGGYMEDADTGLRYFHQLGNLFDPETGYYIAYNPNVSYKVDFKTGKIYSENSEVEIKKTKPHSSRL